MTRVIYMAFAVFLGFGVGAAAKTIKDEGETAPEAPAAIHAFSDVEGLWKGEVREQGVEAPYAVILRFTAAGSGEVHYEGAGYDCRGVLAPRSDGEVLRFIETITLRRDQCSDGEVFITLSGGQMTWAWGLAPNDIYANAILTRAD